MDWQPIEDESLIGVLYRKGLSDEDYDEAIDALQRAKRQPQELAYGCSICEDSGHTANMCHHNPLVMARRAIAQTNVWRCYHCDEVFTDHNEAQEHFGLDETSSPKCCEPTD